MTATAPTTPPKRKRKWVFWGLLLTAILALPAVLLLFVFGPSPPIDVAQKTTYLTEPLADDGLPDYAAVLRDEGREGVTPENNGAIPFLEAVWRPPGHPDAIAQNDAQAEWLFAALGVDRIGNEDARLGSLHDEKVKRSAIRFLRNKLEPMTERQQKAFFTQLDSYQEEAALEAILSGDDERALSEGAANDLIYYCEPIPRPWTRDNLPWLADWREANQLAFERLYEAGRRPDWWLPSASFSQTKRGELIAILLPNVQRLRNVARMLVNDTKWHLGAGRYEDAATSINTSLRLAQHARQEFSLVGQLVACAIEGIALSEIQAQASDPAVPAATLRSLLTTVESMESTSHFGRSMSYGERLWTLDMITAAATTGNISALELDNTGPGFLLRNVSIDWNVVLESINLRYDELGAAMNQATWPARSAALERFEAAANARRQQLMPSSPLDVVRLVTSQRKRGEIAAGIIESLMLPAVAACGVADARVVAKRELTAACLRIAIYRSETGAYPTKLSPDVFPETPVDTFVGEPLVYERTDKGFVLYSLGANGIDDGGSCERGSWGQASLKGVELTDDEDPRHDKIPAGADDIAVRLPVTYEPFPWELAPADSDEQSE